MVQHEWNETWACDAGEKRNKGCKQWTVKRTVAFDCCVSRYLVVRVEESVEKRRTNQKEVRLVRSQLECQAGMSGWVVCRRSRRTSERQLHINQSKKPAGCVESHQDREIVFQASALMGRKVRQVSKRKQTKTTNQLSRKGLPVE